MEAELAEAQQELEALVAKHSNAKVLRHKGTLATYVTLWRSSLYLCSILTLCLQGPYS